MTKRKRNKPKQVHSPGQRSAPTKVPRSRKRLLVIVISIIVVAMVAIVWLGNDSDSKTSELAVKDSSHVAEAPADNDTSVLSVTGGPSIHFPESSYDFGTISQGDLVAHSFVVQNTGTEPLKLIRAKGS